MGVAPLTLTLRRELLFHPIKQWFTKGPVTPLFHRFMWSNIPLHSKFTICGYIFSYYAISVAWPLTVVNYFLEGWNSESPWCFFLRRFEIVYTRPQC